MKLNAHHLKVIENLKLNALKRRLHKEDSDEFNYIQQLSDELNHRFSLYPSSRVIVNPISTDLLWGLCEPDLGVVHILFRWPREDYRIERRTIVRVLCHELTHFKVLGHEADFFALCSDIIEAAKEITGDPKIKMERFINRECATHGF